MKAKACVLLVLVAAVSVVSAQDLVCDDLSIFPPNEVVDYTTDIEPIFDNLGCLGCHGGSGGLTLNGDDPVSELRCTPTQGSVPQPQELRVLPFAANVSWLLLRVNCDDLNDPGFRMPRFNPDFNLTGPEKRLIKDWIDLGAWRNDDILFAESMEEC